jgi:hypothetical protein
VERPIIGPDVVEFGLRIHPPILRIHGSGRDPPGAADVIGLGAKDEDESFAEGTHPGPGCDWIGGKG